MPPIYDDYNDESGFGRVSALGISDPTILEDVKYFHNINESGFGEVMTLFSDTSTILEEVSIDYDSKVPIYDVVMTCLLVNLLCLSIMKRVLFVMVILLNSSMMLLKIFMREDHMLLHSAKISSFLSMC